MVKVHPDPERRGVQDEKLFRKRLNIVTLLSHDRKLHVVIHFMVQTSVMCSRWKTDEEDQRYSNTKF